MTAHATMLIDTASLYFRAFYGLPETLRAADGRPVNAVRGLLDFLARFIGEYSPSQLACCWDDDWRPAWRVDLLPSYKAHRVADGETEEAPDALTEQVPLIRDVLDALGIPIVGAPEMEADDVIGTLAARASGPVDVVTGDRDLFQLVDDARGVRVLYVARGIRRHERVDDRWLAERYGIVGAQYVDFAVLRGDPSDGLPGVRGVGEKTAAALLAKHGDLATALAHLETLTPAVARALDAARDYVAAAGQVVRVVPDLPLPDVDLTLPRTPSDPARFVALARDLNLGGSAERIVVALAQAGEST